VLRFDYDHLTIAKLNRGRGFDEESTMLSMRLWRHERTLEQAVMPKPLCAIASPSTCGPRCGR